jgi:ERCC4-related helicase
VCTINAFCYNLLSSVKTSQRRGRGGRGRPRTGKVRIQLKLSPETNELIERRAAQADVTRSEYVEQTILAAENPCKVR